MRRISRLEQRNHKVLFFAQEMTDGDLLGEVRHWMQPPDEVSSWSERLTVSFVSAVVENMCLQKKLLSIKQRPEENITTYILRFLSEAKLAYPTAWAMGEEGEVVSSLKGTVQADTLGKATEVALVKQAEQKKEHQMMDEEPIEVCAAQTNQESAMF